MSTAISPLAKVGSSSAATTPTQAAPKPAGLNAELAKSESELADWVYCASSKTPEGKHKIQLLTQHIELIKSRIEIAEKAADTAPAPNKAHAVDAPTSASHLSATHARAVSDADAVAASTNVPAKNNYVTTGVFLDLTA